MSAPKGQDDFRKILLKPSSGATQEISEEEKKRRELNALKRAERKKLYLNKQKKKDQRAQKVLEDESKYRDRARERRLADHNQEEDVIDAQKYTIEESKFLGGDVEHTHLVKGLDFTLLRRMREELKEKEASDDTPSAAIPETHSGSKMKVGPTTATTTVPTKRRRVETKPQTIMGRRIHNTLFGNGVKPSNPMFLPGRLAYMFDLKSTPPPIPTAVSRSKEEYAESDQVAITSVEALIIRKISRIALEARDPEAMKRKQHRLAQEEQRRKAEAALAKHHANSASTKDKAEPMDDDDIFGDAGSYNPNLSDDEQGDEPVGESLFDLELRATQEAALAKRKAALEATQAAGSAKLNNADLMADLLDTSDLKDDVGPTAPGPAGPPTGPTTASYPDTDSAYPDTDSAYPDTDSAYPDTDSAYPDTDSAYPDTDSAYPDTDSAYPDKTDAVSDTGQAAKPLRTTAALFGNDPNDDNDDQGASGASAAASKLVARIAAASRQKASKKRKKAESEDSDAAERIQQDMHALLAERGIASHNAEYDAIGLASGVAMDFGSDDEIDPEAEAKKKKKLRQDAIDDAKFKAEQNRKKQKFDNDLKRIASMVDERATKKGGKKMLKESDLAPEDQPKSKKRRRK